MPKNLDPANNVTIIADGSLQIREATFALNDDGSPDLDFPPKYFRYVLHPGDDVSGKDQRIVAVATATWTPEVIEAWKAAQEAANTLS